MTQFGLIKRYSFGLHALNSTVYTLVSLVLFVIIPWLLFGLGIGNLTVAIAFLFVIFVLCKYVPADTKARPLIWKGLIEGMEKKFNDYVGYSAGIMADIVNT